jgi:hypothetical protein
VPLLIIFFQVFSVLRVLNSDAELTERRTLGTGWERMRLLAVSPIVVKGEDWEYVLFASGPHMYAVDAASGGPHPSFMFFFVN